MADEATKIFQISRSWSY